MLQQVLEPIIGRKRGLRGGRDTREEILNTAEDLLQRRGYNAFSYQHIAIQLGIRNAAIHYHFPSKENLGVALVQRYRLRFSEWTEQNAQKPDAWERLYAYFQTYVDFVERGCKICPGGVLGAEFQAIPEEMQHEARLLMREIFAWIVTTLDLGREQGSIGFAGDAEHKAVVIGAALQGSLQIARMAGPERFHQIMQQLSLELRHPQRNSMP